MDYYCADDETASVLSLPDEEEVEDLSVDVYDALKEEAVSAQRLVMMRNAADHVKGHMEMAVVDPSRPWTLEKMFRVSQLFAWDEGAPEEVVNAMRVGRVRARVSATMGLGKSTFLPFYVANQMDHRVLYVAPDAAAIGQVNKYVRTTQKGKIMRAWSEQVRSWVCCMTYADFCGYCALTKRSKMLEHFETIIFDEGFLKKPAVSAALKLFAVVAGPNTNLLLCSANIRTDTAGQNAMSKGSGTVRYLNASMSPEQARATGKLVSDYLVDRTLVVLPDDDNVGDMVAYYLSEGVDARAIDSATDEEALTRCEQWLAGDTVTPRVVVATPRFVLAFNFSIAFVLLWPLECQYELEDEKVIYKIVPMAKTLVNQGLSRAGRSIVNGAGGMVMGPEPEGETELSFFERLEEFVMLSACSVRPLRTAYWEECYTVFPKGLEPLTAQQMRKVNLPAYVSARFLAEDGKFASRYVRALTMFAQTGHYLMPSEHEYPASYSCWVDEAVFESGGRATCRVPVAAVGELQVVLQAIVAMSDGKLELRRWQVPVVMSYHDKMDYQDEAPDVQALQRRKLRRVRSREKPKLALPSKEPERGWTYTAHVVNQSLGGAGTRRGVLLPGDRFTEAVTSMKAVVASYVESPGPVVMVETEGGTKGEVELPPTEGAVESPGGSTVCMLPARTCQLLNDGQAMAYSDFMHLLDAYRSHGRRVVASRLFDCFSRPWTSVCATLLDGRVVSTLVSAGVASQTYQMLSMLNARFGMELTSTVKNSNVYRVRFLKLFKRTPTMDMLMAQIRSGSFTGIAQTDAFISRVLQLKAWLDEALLVAEQYGVYLPGHITEAQRVLPIHSSTKVGHVGHSGMLPAPKYEAYENPMSPVYGTYGSYGRVDQPSPWGS